MDNQLAKNATSGFTPNELVFDFRLRDVVQNRILAAIHDDIQDETVPIAEKREQARQNIALERQKWKKRFDRQSIQRVISS